MEGENKEFSFGNYTQNGNVTQTAAIEEKVSPNANFAIKKYYKECGHSTVQYSEIPKEMINLTKEELEREYREWKIEKFSSNDVILAKNIDGYCDEHFVLKLGEDNIEVYTLEDSGETKLYKTTNISKDYLTSADITNLEEGIYVYGRSNLNSAIEDFE